MFQPEKDDVTFSCPFCGEDVPMGAAACPACGSCEETGWRTESTEEYSEDDEFDYDEFMAREFPDASTPVSWKQWLLAAVVVALCLALVLTSLGI